MSTDSSVPTNSADAVTWARHRRSQLAHAFTDLSAGENGIVEPIAYCVRYPHPDVLRDDLAERCAVCERAVARAEASSG
jgi:hypothetical protein